MESQAMLSSCQAQVQRTFEPNRQGDSLRAFVPCSGWSVVHDLAAFSEGNLSSAGRRRLARHLARCRACRAILASLVRSTQPDQPVDEPPW